MGVLGTDTPSQGRTVGPIAGRSSVTAALPGSIGASQVDSWDVQRKLVESAKRAAHYLAGDTLEQFKALLSPEGLAWLGVSLGAWAASQFVPILGEIVDGAALGYVVATAGVQGAKDLYEFLHTGATAKNDDDLEAAGRALSRLVSTIGVGAFVALLTHGAGKAAKSLRPTQALVDAMEERGVTGAAEIAEEEAAPSATGTLVDVSGRYQFSETVAKNGSTYKTARGELGEPGKVVKHRSGSAQKGVSAGTGDDAGHLIGDRFGAPGDARNLSAQNWRANQHGTFKQLENLWARKLKAGSRIEVEVTDVTRAGEDRPFMRKARWTETLPDGTREAQEMIFANTHTPKSRAARQIPPTVSGPQKNNVINYDFVNKKRLP